MPTISLVLAGVPLEIETPSERLTDLFLDYYSYYRPVLTRGRDALDGCGSVSSAAIRLELDCTSELPERERVPPPGATLISQTGVLGFWEHQQAGETDYYFRTTGAIFHLTPQRGLIRGLVSSSVFEYPHILANTYAMFPLLLMLRRFGIYHLHAAAVISPRGRVWLISGSQRSGKTTLATALGLAGWRPISDDSLLVSADRTSEGGEPMGITALRKYFHLGNELLGRWPQLAGMERRHTYLDRTCVAALEFFGSSLAAEPVMRQVDYLLMPQITGGERSRLAPAPVSEGLLRLGEQSVFLQLWREQTVRQWQCLETIARGANCFRLDAGNDFLEDPLRAADMLGAVEV